MPAFKRRVRIELQLSGAKRMFQFAPTGIQVFRSLTPTAQRRGAESASSRAAGDESRALQVFPELPLGKYLSD
jgi:hypothetical protein